MKRVPLLIAAMLYSASASAATMSLADALAATLDRAPGIRLEQANVDFSRGRVTEEKGIFDPLLTGQFDYRYTRSKLTEAQKAGEFEKRKQLLDTAEVNRKNAERLDAQIAQLRAANPDSANLSGDLAGLQQQIDVLNQLISSSTGGDRDNYVQLRQLLIAQNITQLEQSRDTFKKTESELYDSVRKLGSIPTGMFTNFVTLDVSISRLFMSGVRLGASAHAGEQGTYYEGKPTNPQYGGRGGDDAYNSELKFTMDLPLGRGAGALSTTARLRSAEIQADAERATLEQTTATAALRTTLAYWNYLAARERVAAAQTSLDIQKRLVNVAQALIDADEMARAEINRVQAAESSRLASFASTQGSVGSARISLGETIGLNGDEARATDFSGTFPPFPTLDEVRALDPHLLTAIAMDRRFDVKAALGDERAMALLARAARLDLRPLIGIHGELSYTGIGQGPSVRQGLTDAFLNRWAGPSIDLGVSAEKPIGNNTYKGRLEQREAILRQSVINREDLQRTIGTNISSIVATLAELLQAFDANSRAVEEYKSLIANEDEKLRVKTATIVDTLLTQQQYSDALFSLADARQQIANLLTQLRYETGTLVERGETSDSIPVENTFRLPIGEVRR